MTELAIRDRQPLVAWADTFRATAEVCASLARTPFCPQSLRVMDGAQLDDGATAAQLTAVMLAGGELGIPPIASLRSINIISATPALSSLAMRALVVGRGHEIWTVESTSTRAIVRGRRAGSDHVEESKWDMDRARALGIAGRPNYRTQSTAMLWARANAECCRRVAPDELLGLAYAAEELADGPQMDAQTTETEEVPPAPPRRARRARRKVDTVELPPSEPQTDGYPPITPPARVDTGSDGGPTPDESEPGRPLLLNSAQGRKLHASFNALGITDRDDRLAMTSKLIGRTVESSNELTSDEASALIDELGLMAVRDSDEWAPVDEPSFDQ